MAVGNRSLRRALRPDGCDQHRRHYHDAIDWTHLRRLLGEPLLFSLMFSQFTVEFLSWVSAASRGGVTRREVYSGRSASSCIIWGISFVVARHVRSGVWGGWGWNGTGHGGLFGVYSPVYSLSLCLQSVHSLGQAAYGAVIFG